MGVSRQRAHQIVSQALKLMNAELVEEADEVRRLELERLDGLYKAAWPKAEDGDERAIASCLRIMGRRAELQGLDAAKRKEISGPAGGPIETVDYSVYSDEDLKALGNLHGKYSPPSA